MTSEIRLGCLSCSRDDHDGIDSIPLDWSDVEQVQSYAESIADVAPDDPVASVLDWQTHLGTCPECQRAENGRLRAELDECREQLREQTKSFCTHCGKLFPKGKKGLEQFRLHIAACNIHPLRSLAKDNERLRAENERMREANEARDNERVIREAYVADLEGKAAVLRAANDRLDWRITYCEDGQQVESNEARREVEELRQWVHDLQSGMYINCVYCGHRYGPADEVAATMQEALYEHIAECPRHPLSKAKQELERLRAENDRLKAAEENRSGKR